MTVDLSFLEVTTASPISRFVSDGGHSFCFADEKNNVRFPEDQKIWTPSAWGYISVDLRDSTFKGSPPGRDEFGPSHHAFSLEATVHFILGRERLRNRVINPFTGVNHFATILQVTKKHTQGENDDEVAAALRKVGSALETMRSRVKHVDLEGVTLDDVLNLSMQLHSQFKWSWGPPEPVKLVCF